MSEAEAVKRSTEGPVTREWLVRDLKALGVEPGMLLMVHSSLSRLGWVLGREMTVLSALREAVGDGGTLVMPAFCGDNTDPARWRNPPVPEDWKPLIRNQMPPYDPATAPTREMSCIADYFRGLPGVRRSSHPSASWVAQGPLAERVTAGHSLEMALGEQSPLGRCYELDGRVLSLATEQTTILHFAEYRAEFAGKEYYRQGAAVLIDGRREWVTMDEVRGDNGDFEQLRRDFIAAHPSGAATWRTGRTGYGESRLFRIRPLVDFAVGWMARHRQAKA
jgi:aminoglycoside 3-N-acetyltransferase